MPISIAASQQARHRPQYRLAHAIAAITSVLLLASCSRAPAPTPLLVPINGKSSRGFDGVSPGDPLFFGILPFSVLGDKPVHLLRARVVGVPSGLVIDGIWALRYGQGTQGMVGAQRGQATADRLRPYFRPLNDLILDPRCPPQSKCTPRRGPDPGGTPEQDWYLVVECHTSRPGNYQTTALEVTYQAGTTIVTQSFPSMIDIGENSYSLVTTTTTKSA